MYEHPKLWKQHLSFMLNSECSNCIKFFFLLSWCIHIALQFLMAASRDHFNLVSKRCIMFFTSAISLVCWCNCSCSASVWLNTSTFTSWATCQQLRYLRMHNATKKIFEHVTDTAKMHFEVYLFLDSKLSRKFCQFRNAIHFLHKQQEF